ncbi:hypothetical protein NA57DRAFT_51166 [Rhizodiscina lignyota]|uniref:Uncharacterized protein n=1 Tax=Rhizodiscina lignyota TaxID=1504668 RepID=A0A9P4IS20_9PEZI|nr:hypothetical protein NA57DRAFT_51166 [Rhizodiscina lignyota]
MRHRAMSITGVRRHRLLILLLPVLLLVAFLLQSDSINILKIWSPRCATTTGSNGDAVSRNSSPHRISKVSMLFGKNDLYERALETHREHNEMHGYGMKVLREQLTDGYWNKLLYILSLLVEELAKPPTRRIEWFMWVDAHVVLLNPQIPLDIFLPVQDNNFRETHFIGTRNDGDFVPSVFFIHVHPWSIKLLVKAMAVPMIDELAELGSAMDRRALSYILDETEFRDSVIYQPWHWFHESFSSNAKEGSDRRGTLLAQFPSNLKAARWKQLADCLDRLHRIEENTAIPFEDTFYLEETERFWELARDVNFMLLVTKQLQKGLTEWNEDIAAASSRLEDVLSYDLDQKQQAMEAIEDVKKLVSTIQVPQRPVKEVDKGEWIEPP